MNEKLKKPTDIKENAGKLCLDLGKLIFGSFILGGVLRGEIPQSMILLSGFAGSAVLLGLGLAWTTKEKE